MSFLEELYATETEALPEHIEGVDATWKRDPDGDGLDLHAEGMGCRAPGPGREKRYLPPGSVRDYWRQFCEAYPAA